MAFTNSPLVSYILLSPNHGGERPSIDTITIHCVAAQTTVEALGAYFYDPEVKASSNYGIGQDGKIGLYVEEKNRSWCTSSYENDVRAITIEVSSDDTHPYAVTEAAYSSLIDLLVDICRRNKIKKLLWKADKNLIGQVDQQNMTVHRWFANKECPGEYLYSRHGEIAAAVNKRLGTGYIDTSTNSGYIWSYFMERIGNEYGVAGLMGNLEAESGLYPDRVQGDNPYSSYSKLYTAKVDSGEYTEEDFVYNGPGGGGYGLAQWTWDTRKKRLYDMWKQYGYPSIGSLSLGCAHLWWELQNLFPGVLEVLINAKTIREASDKVLHDFEAPSDQSEEVEKTRESNGIKWYSLYVGYSPGGTGSKKRRISKFNFILFNRNRRWTY